MRESRTVKDALYDLSLGCSVILGNGECFSGRYEERQVSLMVDASTFPGRGHKTVKTPVAGPAHLLGLGQLKGNFWIPGWARDNC